MNDTMRSNFNSRANLLKRHRERIGSLDAQMYATDSGKRSRVVDNNSINYEKGDSLISKQNFLNFKRAASPKYSSRKSKTSRQKYNTLKAVPKVTFKNYQTLEGQKQNNSMSNLETEREYYRNSSRKETDNYRPEYRSINNSPIDEKRLEEII